MTDPELHPGWKDKPPHQRHRDADFGSVIMWPSELAPMYFTHEELWVIGQLIDAKMTSFERSKDGLPEGWVLLNSLRTAFTEARWSLERLRGLEDDDDEPDDDDSVDNL